MIRLLKNDAITIKDIELNNVPLCRLAIYYWDSFWGRALLLLQSFYSNAIYNPYWVSVYYLTNSHILQILGNQTKYRPLNLCRLILSLDVAINKCQREVSTLTLFHISVALQTLTKMQFENNFYGSSVLDGEARSSG